MPQEFIRYEVSVEAGDAEKFEEKMRFIPEVEDFTRLENPVITNLDLQKYARIINSAYKKGETKLTVKNALQLRKVASKLSDEDRLLKIAPSEFGGSHEKNNDEDWLNLIDKTPNTELQSIRKVIEKLNRSTRKLKMSIGDVRELIESGKNLSDLTNIGKPSAAFIMIVFCDIA